MTARAEDLLEDSARPTAIQREVLFVCLARGLGGSTRSLATVLEGLPSSFRRVVCTPSGGPFLRSLRERNLVEVHIDIPNRGRRLTGKLSRFAAMFKVASWVRSHRGAISAMHANGPEELNLVAPVARLYGVPVVVWSHARDVSPSMRRLRPLLRLLLRGVDVRWASVSGHARDVLVEAGLCLPDAVEIIPNPIDPEDVVGATTTGRDDVVIGYLGSDAPYKGFLLLPDVIEALGYEGVRWLIFSNERASRGNDAWTRLRALPAERATVVGKVADVGGAYAQCDIVFLPSLEESFGRVAAEAMLNGVPVVASDLAPVREVLGRDEAGLFFPPGDVIAASRRLRELIDDPSLRVAMGEAGRRRARQFEPRSVVRALTRLYSGDVSVAD
ncbi:MAG: glycosyltransferase family 4 protein [Actinomycetota bacterium]